MKYISGSEIFTKFSNLDECLVYLCNETIAKLVVSD